MKHGSSLILLGLMLAGCSVNRCKQGTLLVEVLLSGGAESAEILWVDASTADRVPIRTKLEHTPGVSSGRIQIDFPSGYPAGKAVTLTVTAERGGRTLARSPRAITVVGPGCDSIGIEIQGDAKSGDGGMAADAMSCPHGYVLNEAMDGCQWHTVPLDPEFKGSAWTVAGGAVLDPTAPGVDDVGQLVLDKGAVCNAGGSAHQSITMPSFAESEAFALIHTVQRDCQTSGAGCAGGTAAVRFRGGAVVIPTSNSLVKRSNCLGARGYDGTFDMVVAPGDKNDCADPMLTVLDLRVDRLSIVPDAKCPQPASIKNATFDGDPNDWGLQLNNGSATIDVGIGVNGSRAGHITTSRLCQAPKLRGTQSVPMGAQVALQVLIKGSAGKVALVGEESNLPRWASVTASGSFDTARVCVPEYAKGMVLPLILSTETPTGPCATLDVRDFVFDDLSFVTESSCPMTTLVVDPGFERHAALPQWTLTVYSPASPNQAAATVVADPSFAHGGTSALRLSSKQLCTSARGSTVITVPEPTATAGPAIKFFYRAPALTNTTAFANVQTSQVALSASATYKQASLCLDPARAGQGQYFEVAVSASGTCGRMFGEEFVFFDDFEVTTDPGCPAK